MGRAAHRDRMARSLQPGGGPQRVPSRTSVRRATYALPDLVFILGDCHRRVRRSSLHRLPARQLATA